MWNDGEQQLQFLDVMRELGQHGGVAVVDEPLPLDPGHRLWGRRNVRSRGDGGMGRAAADRRQDELEAPAEAAIGRAVGARAIDLDLQRRAFLGPLR